MSSVKRMLYLILGPVIMIVTTLLLTDAFTAPGAQAAVPVVTRFLAPTPGTRSLAAARLLDPVVSVVEAVAEMAFAAAFAGATVRTIGQLVPLVTRNLADE